MPKDLPKHPYRVDPSVENLSPEIDLQNYTVAQHLSDFFDSFTHLGHQPKMVGVNAEKFQAAQPPPFDGVVTHKMPPGLYAHLVDISKMPAPEWPERVFNVYDQIPVPSVDPARAEQEQKVLALIDEVFFAPGTVNDQQGFMCAADYATIRKYGRDRLEPNTNRATLQLGFQGTYHRDDQVRQVWIAHGVNTPFMIDPKHGVVTAQRLHGRPELCEKPDWVRPGVRVRELMGQRRTWHIALVSSGLTLKTSNVILVDPKNPEEHSEVTIHELMALATPVCAKDVKDIAGLNGAYDGVDPETPVTFSFPCPPEFLKRFAATPKSES